MPFNYDAVKEILRCPKSHSPLLLDGSTLVCTDAACRLKFDIRDDIPILLLDEAEELPQTDWQAVMDRAESPE